MIEVETLLTINRYLAIDGVFGIIVVLALLIDLYTKQYLKKYVLAWGKYLMGLVVLGGVVMTLIYSEVFGVAPCGFCWFERVFLYPQLFIIAIGIYLKDKMMPYYTLILSAIGFFIAIYHHYVQMGGGAFLPCPASGVGDCSARFLYEFGFVTFPLLAAVAFGFLFVVSLYLIKTSSQVTEDSLSVQG